MVLLFKTQKISEFKYKTALEAYNVYHPTGRMSTPQAVANSIAFAFSDNASWVTGAIWDTHSRATASRN